MEFVIRRIQPDDYKDIHVLNQQLGYEYKVEKVYERIVSLLETGTDIISVAQSQGNVIGYIHGCPYETLYSDKLFNIVNFVVDKRYENNIDVNKELFNAFENKVRKNGYTGIRVASDISRTGLFSFFIDNGFESKRDLRHYLKHFKESGTE